MGLSEAGSGRISEGHPEASALGAAKRVLSLAIQWGRASGVNEVFTYAGTPAVRASLSKVEDSSTAALMASFDKNFRSMSTVEALKQVQLELIRGKAGSESLERKGQQER